MDYVNCPKCDTEYKVTWGDENMDIDCKCGAKLVVVYDEYYDEEANEEYSYWWLEERK